MARPSEWDSLIEGKTRKIMKFNSKKNLKFKDETEKTLNFFTKKHRKKYI